MADDDYIASEGRLLTAREAATYIGITTKTLENWRSTYGRKKIGPAFIRISHRCVRYRESDLKEWLESRTIRPET